MDYWVKYKTKHLPIVEPVAPSSEGLLAAAAFISVDGLAGCCVLVTSLVLLAGVYIGADTVADGWEELLRGSASVSAVFSDCVVFGSEELTKVVLASKL